MANVRYPGTAGTTPETITASEVTYDNTTSGLTADDVQEAIDEIEGQISGLSYDASDISYDNTSSGLTADDVQEAIDEIDSNLDTLDAKVYKTDDSTETTIASDDLLPIYDTSATASKKITVENVVKATVSNPNLLDNPWFTVNQRGLSSYTADNYSFDRWKILGSGAISISGGVLTLENTNPTFWANLRQFINPTIIPSLLGKKVTLSILLSDGTIISEAGTMPTTTPSIETNIINKYLDDKSRIQFIYNNGLYFVNVAVPSGSTSINNVYFKAVKLEVGSVSTLALDTAPNYATELLKCQRYFQRISTDDSHTLVIGSGHCYGAYLMFDTFLPVPMRANPTLTVNGGVSACRINVNGSGKVVTSFGGVNLTNNIISMTANTASDIGLNGYAGDVHIRAESGNTLSLNFSADL